MPALDDHDIPDRPTDCRDGSPLPTQGILIPGLWEAARAAVNPVPRGERGQRTLNCNAAKNRKKRR